MKGYRIRSRSILALLLCAVFIAAGPCAPASAGSQAATPTDLAEREEPFAQTMTVDGVRITVTADPGVFAAGETLSAGRTDDAAFIRAAEEALAGEAGGNSLVFHTGYFLAGARMNGKARVKLEKLNLAETQERYPDGEIRAFVLRFNENAQEPRDRAQVIPARVNIERNTIEFTITETGLYETAVLVPLPEEPEPAEPQGGSLAEETPEAAELSAPEEEEPRGGEQDSPAEGLPDEPDAPEHAAGDDGAPGPEPGEEKAGTEKTEGTADQVAAFVTRCYELILGRKPDPAGQKNWTEKLKRREATAAQIISGFMNSGEFTGKHVSSEKLVGILYRTMLNREPDRNGKANWIARIAEGFSINRMINGFCGSAEFKALCANYGIEGGNLPNDGETAPIAYSEKVTGFVARCYREALGREPDEKGLYNWCRQLAQKHKTYREVATGFVFSEEMKIRFPGNTEFIKALYRLYLGREADAAGLENWKAKMAGGTTREQVNEGFAKSAEFAGIIASFNPEADRAPDYTCTIAPGITNLPIGNGDKVKVELSPQLRGRETELRWACTDGRILMVSQDGEIFGNYPGKTELKAMSPAGKTIASVTVTVQAKYRAVLFSESTYKEGTIRRNRGDVRLMKGILSAVTGPDGGEYSVASFDDLNAGAVYRKISELLIQPSREGDVSLFMFAGHGDYRSTSEKYAGRLWCRMKKTWLELPELAKQLSRVQGKVIVLLESCGPGAALIDWGKQGVSETGMGETDDPEMSQAIISAFAAADPGIKEYRSGSGTGKAAGNLFLTEKFIVMTASGHLQSSYSSGSDASNLFPYWLTKGVGTSGPMPADTECGNGDGLLTVHELFQYVYKHTVHRQTPQVYPQNCGYVLFKR